LSPFLWGFLRLSEAGEKSVSINSRRIDGAKAAPRVNKKSTKRWKRFIFSPVEKDSL
jgi:hypothetical protein